MVERRALHLFVTVVLQKYYKIGDYIIVSDNESQTSIEAQVIGYLGKLNMIMDLNVATDDGNMSNQLMLSNVENVVLTNVRMLQDWENSEPSIYNVIEVKNSNAITKLYNSNEIVVDVIPYSEVALDPVFGL